MHTTLLQGDWLEGHMRAGTVTVLSGEEDLKGLREEVVEKKISILKCPKFWRENAESVNLRINSLKRHVKYYTEWGYLYSNDCESVKVKMNVQNYVIIGMFVNYM